MRSSGRSSSEDVKQGRILWLPRLEDPQAITNVQGGGSITERLYNHPVLVLDRSDKHVDFLVFTTLQRQKLEQWAQHSSEYRFFVPTSNERRHPSSDPMYKPVALKNGSFYGEPGYLRLKNIFRIDFCYLRPDHNENKARKYMLCKDSMRRVLELCQRLHPHHVDLASEPPLPRSSQVVPPSSASPSPAPAIPANQAISQLLPPKQAALDRPLQDHLTGIEQPRALHIPAGQTLAQPLPLPVATRMLLAHPQALSGTTRGASVQHPSSSWDLERQPLLSEPSRYASLAARPRPWWPLRLMVVAAVVAMLLIWYTFYSLEVI